MSTFAQMMDAASKLSLEEQEEIVREMRLRISEQRRSELATAVKDAKQEFDAGKIKPASPSAIMKLLRA